MCQNPWLAKVPLLMHLYWLRFSDIEPKNWLKNFGSDVRVLNAESRTHTCAGIGFLSEVVIWTHISEPSVNVESGWGCKGLSTNWKAFKQICDGKRGLAYPATNSSAHRSANFCMTRIARRGSSLVRYQAWFGRSIECFSTSKRHRFFFLSQPDSIRWNPVNRHKGAPRYRLFHRSDTHKKRRSSWSIAAVVNTHNDSFVLMCARRGRLHSLLGWKPQLGLQMTGHTPVIRCYPSNQHSHGKKSRSEGSHHRPFCTGE